LAGHDGADVNVAVQATVNVDMSRIVERVIGAFDREPDIKARIAQALLEVAQMKAPITGAASSKARIAPAPVTSTTVISDKTRQGGAQGAW
jgi:hypothetical protein